MLRARSVALQHKPILDQIDCCDPATLTGVQLLASSPTELRDALTVLTTPQPSHPHWQSIRAIDLNFGCPSPEVTQYGNGPAMLKRKSKMAGLFKELCEWRQRGVGLEAVGAKIRLGMSATEKSHKVYLKVAEIAAEEGLDYLVVHPRHAGQRTVNPATWECIKEVVELLQGTGVKVIGNGDVKDAVSCHQMIHETGCDGVMLGRAAIHNPWIFRSLDGAQGPLWPTLLEVDQAEAKMRAWGEQCGTKSAVMTFHTQNLARVRQFVETGEMATVDVPRATVSKSTSNKRSSGRRHGSNRQRRAGRQCKK